MSFIKPLLALSTISLLSGCVVIAKPSTANFHQQQQRMLSAENLTSIAIEAGAGSLTVIGSAQATEISVSADIYTQKSNANGYELDLYQSGDKARLVAKMTSSSGFWVGESPHINLKVTVPQSLMTSIDDGSGNITINHLTNKLDIQDGSGDITINDVSADVTIDDGSGDIVINKVAGNLVIEDGSGEIMIRTVGGDLIVDDNSGDMTIHQVAGSADIEDSSGDMLLRDIVGLVTIDDGSGDIDVEKVGSLKIIDDGSGDLRVQQVKAGFSIDQ